MRRSTRRRIRRGSLDRQGIAQRLGPLGGTKQQIHNQTLSCFYPTLLGGKVGCNAARVTREHGRHVPLAMRFSLQGEGWEQGKKSTQPTGSCHNRSSWFRVFKGSHQLPKKAWGLKAGGFPAFMSTLGCSVAIIRLCMPGLAENPRNNTRILGPNHRQSKVTVMISQSNMFGSVFSVLSPRAINRPKGAAVGFVSVWCIGGSPGGLLDP